MSNAPYYKYRKRLAAFACDAPLIDAIAAARGRAPWWPVDRKWVRTYERFHPDREPYAKLVFESAGSPQVIFEAEVFEEPPAERAEGIFLARDDRLGWIRVARFPCDVSLPTIASVLASGESATVVRYRPGRRCTIRLDDDGRTRFAKIYPRKFLRRHRGEQLHAVGTALWRAARQGKLGFAVARTEAWDASAASLWQERIDGVSVRPKLFGPEAPMLAHRLGRAAASLTRCDVAPRETFDWAAQVEASTRFATELRSRIPTLSPAADDLLDELSKINERAGSRPQKPIHGDMDASQWLDDGSRFALTDFDDFALGDPELDVATFIAELEREDGLMLPIERVAGAFVEAFESVAGPLNRSLLAAYLAHKQLFNALRCARALRADGDARAESYLMRACASAGLGSRAARTLG